jgi:hypothetical protein
MARAFRPPRRGRRRPQQRPRGGSGKQRRFRLLVAAPWGASGAAARHQRAAAMCVHSPRCHRPPHHGGPQDRHGDLQLSGPGAEPHRGVVSGAVLPQHVPLLLLCAVPQGPGCATACAARRRAARRRARRSRPAPPRPAPPRPAPPRPAPPRPAPPRPAPPRPAARLPHGAGRARRAALPRATVPPCHALPRPCGLRWPPPHPPFAQPSSFPPSAHNTVLGPDTTQPPAYGMATSYNMYVPSSAYILSIFKAYAADEVAYMRAWLALLGGCILKLDHSFKLSKVGAPTPALCLPACCAPGCHGPGRCTPRCRRPALNCHALGARWAAWAAVRCLPWPEAASLTPTLIPRPLPHPTLVGHPPRQWRARLWRCAHRHERVGAGGAPVCRLRQEPGHCAGPAHPAHGQLQQAGPTGRRIHAVAPNSSTPSSRVPCRCAPGGRAPGGRGPAVIAPGSCASGGRGPAVISTRQLRARTAAAGPPSARHAAAHPAAATRPAAGQTTFTTMHCTQPFPTAAGVHLCGGCAR